MRESMKDKLLNAREVGKIAGEIVGVFDNFEQEKFEQTVLENFDKLGLKERVEHICECLYIFLPKTYLKAISILMEALPAPLDEDIGDGDFGAFIYASYGAYVAKYGAKKEYLEISFMALAEMTKRFSMEYAIRDFIEMFPKESYTFLDSCATSDNYHLRRLASEGLRLKLPWAKDISIDYHYNAKILDQLYHDRSRFVTRSVANHLNDISKIDPAWVIAKLEGWKEERKQSPKEMQYIIKHALRTLLKKGDSAALTLLEYNVDVPIMIEEFTLEKSSIMIGERIGFLCRIKAASRAKVLVNYVIYYRRKDGSFYPKVYKLTEAIMIENKTLEIVKKHLFKSDMKTRTFYVGRHKIEIQINGKIVASLPFTLKERDAT